MSLLNNYVELVLKWIIFHDPGSVDVSCSSIQVRESWEMAFDNAFIKPVVEVHIIVLLIIATKMIKACLFT